MKKDSNIYKKNIKLKTFLENFSIKMNESNSLNYLSAFTHSSYSNEHKLNYSYQRLECLGDAILSKEITLFLYIKYPDKNEGEISNWRSIIVRKETLAEIGSSLKLGKNILLGHGEIKTKGYEKENILADVLEAFIAAVYLDKGEKFTRKFVKNNIINYVYDKNLLNTVLDYKTELQEILQSTNKMNPKYIIVDEKWEHNKNITKKILYNVIVFIGDIYYGRGKGYSIKEAEQNAAKSALDKLTVKNKKRG